MKTFNKSVKLNNVLYDVRGPALDEADAMEARGVEILKLNTGNPGAFGFHVPQKLLNEMERNLASADAYSNSKGIISARTAVAEYCKKKGMTGVDIGDIYTGNGVSELIMMSMQALLDKDDELLIPSPDYPLWTAAATLSGGTPVHYVCDEASLWYPDLDDIRKKITPRTKGIVVINPNNPTGALYPAEILEEIADIARAHGLIIFADEIYDKLVMDGNAHTAIASVAADIFTVTFNGLSKSHRAAGFRTGWMSLSGDRKRAKGYIEGLNMLSSMRLCSNVPSQYIIAAALNSDEPDLEILPGGRIYEQRDLITNAVNLIPGLSVVKPSAAFYIFPKIDTKRFNITDDERFILDFLKAEHILLVHGRGFNLDKPDHFRIVYLPEAEKLKSAAASLSRFLETYRQN
ncbi:MAG: pyridoxal phosphate-dependent aminotransferase [Oscillospiraceae bacterium]|nr:pyridoxal phosphate-dependent aminotransferase [Oscillospiraceae bacterium]